MFKNANPTVGEMPRDSLTAQITSCCWNGPLVLVVAVRGRPVRGRVVVVVADVIPVPAPVRERDENEAGVKLGEPLSVLYERRVLAEEKRAEDMLIQDLASG